MWIATKRNYCYVTTVDGLAYCVANISRLFSVITSGYYLCGNNVLAWVIYFRRNLEDLEYRAMS